MFRTVSVLLVLSMLSSCKKEDEAQPAPSSAPPLQIIGVPIPGIFTWVEDATTMGYLQTDDFDGIVFRGSTGNTYPLEDLAQDNNCRVEMIGDYAPDGRLTYGIHIQGTENWWMPIYSGGDGAWRLETMDLGTEQLPAAGTNWRWIRHQLGTADGHPMYAMESYDHPDLYWSLNFPMSCGSCIKLVEHDDPTSAQGFIFR
ncbi:MAG: hypothetical protein JNM62_08720 [Flavobacteriales bacterium]|nr:hypothetical protein [Flavobacteriales bacterium]